MKQKVDYDVINRETLEKCEMKNGKIVNEDFARTRLVKVASLFNILGQKLL